MAKEAKEAGADGILLMPPHMWLRFGMNPDAPFEYVKDVAEGADIDIIIHLYPATSKAFYPVETLIKMCKEIDHVKCIKMGTRVTSIYEHDVRLLRQECPDISLITCHDETLCVSWFPGMDGALIGFAGCVPEIICPAREVFANPDKHTLKEAQDWSDRIYHISQAIYGGGQPSGEAHARLKRSIISERNLLKCIDEKTGTSSESGRKRLGFFRTGTQSASKSRYGTMQIKRDQRKKWLYGKQDNRSIWGKC